jgi:hypothetical protein
MNRKKIILCEGDSWTAGDIVDPELEKKGIIDSNEIPNRPYRLPKVWPGKLEKLIKGVRVLNSSISGSSNDAIVRRVIGMVLYLINERKYKPEDISVIVGWSSPERKDFYYSGDYDSTETIYPHESNKIYDGTGLNEFHKLYVTYFWNKQEYLLRFIRQVILLDGFLKSKGIKYKFFNAFYEVEDSSIIESNKNFNFLENLKTNVIKMNHGKIDNNPLFSLDILISEIDKIYKTNFIDISFQEFISSNINKKENREKYFKNYHPTELSHELWAEFLSKQIEV